MPAIAAAWSENPEKAKQAVTKMLSMLKHRSEEGYWIAGAGSAFRDREITPLASSRLKGPAVVGVCVQKILAKDETEPCLFGDSALALDGRFYGSAGEADSRYLAEKLRRKNSAVELASMALAEPGAFSVAIADPHRLTVIRDPVGLKPLYSGAKDGVSCFASERKALWALQIEQVEPVPPGTAKVVEQNGSHDIMTRSIAEEGNAHGDIEGAAQRLRLILEEAAKAMTYDVDFVGVCFSGGLDSTVTAKLLHLAGLEVSLLTVGLPDQPELRHGREVASRLGIPHDVEVRGESEVDQYVRRLLWLIEEPNLMKLSVAIPLHWTAELARKNGVRILFTGQGSDELYGGYRKFAQILQRQGSETLSEALRNAVLDSHEVNFARDEKATNCLGVELRSAFTHPRVVEYSMGLPLQFKVRSGDDVMRKWVLRTAAERIGVPQMVLSYPKKAIQHATGIEAAIRGIARRKSMSVRNYLIETFSEVKKLTSMP